MFRDIAGRVGSLSRQLFTDREVFMRAHGELRFITITARAQKVAASVVAVLFVMWATFSGNVIWSQYNLSNQRDEISGMFARASDAAQTATTNRREAEQRADELEARQDVLEALATDYFGLEDEAFTKPAKGEQGTALERIKTLETRQTALVTEVEQIANLRAEEAEATVRKLGLNIDRLARASASAQGGPFIPFGDAEPDEDLVRLGEALGRLDRLERALMAVPSFMPADGGRLSSRFGFRRDPFTRRAAMHNGQDFKGARNSAIRAAANGRVVRAGWWSGYGRAVEIDHGGGLRTRYAHMTKLDVKVGDRVTRGMRIGGMGSTGRSTGTHLHFEVRIDGRAVNPRPFLEAPEHVLEIQDIAGRRLEGGANAG